MGVGSHENEKAKEVKDIKLEVDIPGHPLHSFKSLAKVAKSICKIFIDDKLGSGFFIKFFKQKKDFYCLVTNEHVITKKMIKDKKKIDVYYDNEDKNIEIYLNPEKRFIKEFKDIKMDVSVIEILSEDNIPKEYFLLPFKDYMDNYEKYIGEDIAIIQYPKGEINYSYGKIKSLTSSNEFAHDAGTQEGSSGSPIFLKCTTKVMGIHKGGIDIKNQNIKENYGDFIWPIFSYFKNFSENKIELDENNNNFYDELNNNEIENEKISDNNNNLNSRKNGNDIKSVKKKKKKLIKYQIIQL